MTLPHRFLRQGLAIVGFCSLVQGCASPTFHNTTPPVTHDSSVAKIVLTRPSWMIGGRIHFIVLDTGDVMSGSSVATKSALWCEFAAAALPERELAAGESLQSPVGLGRSCTARLVLSKDAATNKQRLALVRQRQFARLTSNTAEFHQLEPSGSICLASPPPSCQHGVEVGQVGNGGELVWYRRPGTLTIRVLGPNAEPYFEYFLSDPVQVEGGKTYTFEARHGVIRRISPQ